MAQHYSPRLLTDGLLMCLDASQNTSLPTIDLPVKNGLVMWMDAADDSTFSYSSGTTVSQWRDKSGLNYHMVPLSAGPSRGSFLNSRKVLSFTTAQTIGSLSLNLETSENTVFVVSRLTGVTNSRVLTAYYNNWLLGHWGGYVNEYYAEGWIAYAINTADTTWRIYMGDWGGSSNDIADAFSNGTSVRNQSSAQASAGPKGLGINYQGTEPSTCEAAEIIVFNRRLSDIERKKIHTYLGIKWGISNTDRSVFDLSGKNNNGLLGNGTAANMPSIDYYNKGSLNFDGSNDYIVIPSSANIKNTENLTLEAWIYISNITGYYAGIIGKGTSDADEEYCLLIDSLNSRVYMDVGSGGGPYTNISYSFSTNIWYHVVGTHSRVSGSSSLNIYVNGQLLSGSTTNPTNTVNDNSTSVSIGSRFSNGTSPWNGKIANVKIYGKVLSLTEVIQNYEAQKSKFVNTIIQQGLVLNLDAGNPYSYAGAGTTWYDVSSSVINASNSGTSYYSSSNGGLLNFPGNSSYYYTASSSAFNLGSASFSMEAWVYLDASTSSDNAYRGVISLGSDSSNYVYISKWRSGLYSGLYVQYVAGATTITGVYQANDYNPVSRWTHVIATKSGSTLSFYVNGVLYGSMTNLTTTFTGNSSIYIAQAHSGVNSLNGYMGEARIYNISLSAAQVLQNYNATKDRFGL